MKTKPTSKRTTKRYIERTLSVSKLIKMIPEELLEEIGIETQVDHQVKHLHGALMFKLFLYSILKSERLSTRLMEFFYNSSEFTSFSDKGGHKTRHSSIADRLKTIDAKYFEQIFLVFGEKLEKQFRTKSKKVAEILRFDSSLVTIGSGLVDYGFQVSKKSTQGQGKNQIKFTIGLKGLLPSDAQLYTQKEYSAEDIALGEAILKSSYKKDSIVVFDRGLKKRNAFAQFDAQGISFVTRANTQIKYEKVKDHKKIKGRKTETLILEEDLLVYLFDRYHKKMDVPFRLIRAIIKRTGEPIYFLTNIKDMMAGHVTEIYHRRWDIEVFFRFIKQELNFSSLVSYDKNGIKVMMYMILITSMMILIYKKVNKIDGYKISKLAFIDELQMGIVKEIVIACGGDPKKMKSMYDIE
jgi:hypothetical protein